MTDWQPSKLGTREYWDDFYQLEKKNFQENSNDTGECWFSDSNAEEKMIEYLTQLDDEGFWDTSKITAIDLGSGNGRLLFSLREAGYDGDFVGLDYSQPAVEFANKIALAEGHERIEFRHADFLSNNDWNSTGAQWDLILDKGTLDAIALSGLEFEAEGSGSKIPAVQQYVKQVEPLLKETGLFVITSCNFTKEELLQLFVNSSTNLKLCEEIKYPTFRFGGSQGSTVTSLIFASKSLNYFS